MTKTAIAKVLIAVIASGAIHFSQGEAEKYVTYTFSQGIKFSSRTTELAIRLYQSIQKSVKMLQALLIRHPKKASSIPRVNFALLSSGAKVIFTEEGMLNPSSLLSKNQDQYLSFACDKVSFKKPKSIAFSLEEDALVDSINLLFLEGFSNYIEHFKIYVSISSSSVDWIMAGKFQVKNFETSQTFYLKKPKLARMVKITFLSAYHSDNHYCTITQLQVFGKTYLSYSTEKTAMRLNREIVKSIHNDFSKQSKDLEQKVVKQEGLNQSMMIDLHTSLKQAVKALRQRELVMKEVNERTSCHKFQELKLYAKNQCSTSIHLFRKVKNEGPLESYFDVLNSKIEVSL